MNTRMLDVESAITLYGQDTQEIRNSGDSRLYRTEHSTGTGIIEKYEVFPGIQLYNQFFLRRSSLRSTRLQLNTHIRTQRS